MLDGFRISVSDVILGVSGEYFGHKQLEKWKANGRCSKALSIQVYLKETIN